MKALKKAVALTAVLTVVLSAGGIFTSCSKQEGEKEKMKITINNPVIDPATEGWHADPEAREYEGKYWIYATRSMDYSKQLNLDVYSSEDLSTWETHSDIIDMEGFPWVKRAVWAPTAVEKDGKYYLIFASNDIQNDKQKGGLEIAVADNPAGPFKGYLGKPLIDRFINGAQPIDAHFFKDDDGTIYLFYGGWKHCNVAIMNDDMTGFVPFEDGETFKEVTPAGYVEGPCMFKRNGLYYFMWSVGAWTDGSYCVEYAISKTPTGPFKKESRILQSQSDVANGPGHNGYLYISDLDMYLMVYHRHPITETEGNSRAICIDKMTFNGDKINRVIMTDGWSNQEDSSKE